MGGGEAAEDQQLPLLQPLKRTGTIWTAVAHIITGVIGAGVLSLAWSVAQLGWIAGPLLMIVFASVTILSNNLLSDCYRFPESDSPTRVGSYMEAVKVYLGEKSKTVCAIFVHESLYGCGIAYVITAASSVKAIQRSNCYHKEGHEASCQYGTGLYMMLFGLVQIVVSQIPDFHNMEWLSVVAAIMSFTYSFIGLGLGMAKAIENGRIQGSLAGVPTSNVADKLWLVFQALGDIAFAYPYSIILLEIQDTLNSPPPENQTMKKASMIAIFVTTFFYLCCGCFGYAAFGNDTPGNLLTGFGFYEPYWLIDFANACIVLHLVGGYQVYSQPVFAVAERWSRKKYPNSGFVNNFYSIKIPLLPRFQVNPFRLCFRTVYVVSTTAIAMIFPYFNQVLGVLGALNFWPLAIYFPVEMYFVQKRIGAYDTDETNTATQNLEREMGGHGAIEVAKTVMEVADVAWTAMEHGRHHLHHEDHDGQGTVSDEELEALRAENRRLRNSLEQNLKLLENLSESPAVLDDCPPDLYARLVATVDSNSFLTRIKALQKESIDDYQFPFKPATGSDLEQAEVLIKIDNEEASWWVWITDDMIPGKVEERSGIDNESYVVVSEEHVMDGIANFMAKCIVSNPKARNLTPEELQKIVAKAMGGVGKLEKVLGIWHAGKLFYTLSTWGLALTGLYRSRAVLKFAAMGLHTTSKAIMRAM